MIRFVTYLFTFLSPCVLAPLEILWKRRHTIIIILLFLTELAYPQQDDEKVSVKLNLASDEGKIAGAKFAAVVELTITEGYHVYAPFKQDTDVPVVVLKVEPLPVAGFTFGAPKFPEPIEKTFSGIPGRFRLYEGKTRIPVLVEIAKDVAAGEYTLTFALTYQVCSDKVCYLPKKDIKYNGKIIVGSGSSALRNSQQPQDVTPNNSSQQTAMPESSEEFERLLKEAQSDDFTKGMDGGFLYALLAAFLGGVLASITPCVYPMIPITVAFFAGQAEKTRSKVFSLALIYILGMALTYSALGIVAGLAGSALSSYLGNPYVVVAVALFFALMGLSMFGAFELRMPNFITSKLGSAKRGWLGALFMGLIVGFVAAPCVGPILAGILTFIANKKDPLLGFAFLFTFALGMGVLFVVVAMLPKALPKSGGWLVIIKNIFGVILFAVAIWYLSPLLSLKATTIVITALLLILATYIFVRARKSESGRTAHYNIGIVALVLSVLFSLGLALKYDEKFSVSEHITSVLLLKNIKVDWVKGERAGLEMAAREKKPAIIDFYAEWCVACKEMEITTFSDSNVLDALKRFVAIKNDVTNIDSGENKRILEKYKIQGPPALAFYNSEGKYLGRLQGTIDANKLLTLLGHIR